MKRLIIYILFSVSFSPFIFSQTLAEAKELYLKGDFEKALPVFEAEYNAKPTDANLNQWYGVCLFETEGDMVKAEQCLLVASKRKIRDSFYYLGQLYTKEFRFTEAEEAFDSYESLLKKNDNEARENLEEKRKIMSRFSRVVSNTEDIQIIDSLVVDKSDFLSAYKLSHSAGRIEYFDKVFSANKNVSSTVYFNEKETKIYYGQPDKNEAYTLFSMEKLFDGYGNEKQLSATNFGLTGDINYPFVMPDGVTIYFAAKDYDSLGGYDLFVSRYNMNNDSYLAPERLNMPFNSMYNDYLMVIDEEKGVGWFASDRFQPEGKVCIYTFLPNNTVKIVESDDEKYIADRARINSIRSSWIDGKDYTPQITLARTSPKEEKKIVRDFEFVINNKYTYYKLADFKNKTARDTYYSLIQKKNEANRLQRELDEMRTTYSKADDTARRNMSDDILTIEKRLENLHSEIMGQEILARNQEIESL